MYNERVKPNSHVKGSELSPQDSSKLRVEVLLYLSWLNTIVIRQPISSM